MAKTKRNHKGVVDVIRKVSKKQAPQNNPFEVHINRTKFKVLGQKSKNDVGLPGVSRSKALQKRKVTLLQEYKFQHKTNKFFDRRIGEHNKNMTKEDKIMARFTAEKMKAHSKSSLFNLDDDVVLTHGGRMLEEIEQFEDPRSDDEDDGDGRNMKGALDSEFVKEAHFGGGMLSVASQDGELSRKNLISQLIADSKKRKHEKQQLKESTMKLTEELDTEWKNLLPLFNTKKQSEEDETKPNSEKSKDSKAQPTPAPKPAVDKSSFDYLVQELRFEATGKPSDKLKLEDEIVREEKEKLEKLERERLRRMTLHESDKVRASTAGRAYKSADDLDDGFALEDVNNEDDNQSETSDKHDEQSESECEVNTDEEEEKIEEKEKADKGVKRKLDDADDEPKNELEEENGEDEGSSDEDSLDDLVDNEDSNDEVEEEKDDDDDDKRKFTKKETKHTEILQEDKANDNDGNIDSIDVFFKDANDIKEDKANEGKECLKKKSIRFAVNDEIDHDKNESHKAAKKTETTDNVQQKDKMCENKGILKNTRNQNEDSEIKAVESRELEEELAKTDLPFTFEVPQEYEQIVELLDGRSMKDVRIIMDRMIKVNHWSLGGDNKAKLNQLFAFLLQYLDDSVNSKEPKKCWKLLNTITPVAFDLCLMDPDTSGGYLRSVIQEKYETFSEQDLRYPSVHSLIFLKLVSTLFPTSDARHYVTTPALIFLCHALGKSCPVSTRDVAIGQFLATLCVEYIDLSKRYLPELINYVRGILLLFCRSLPLPLPKPFKSPCKHLLAFEPRDLVELQTQLKRDMEAKKTEEKVLCYFKSESGVNKSSPRKKSLESKANVLKISTSQDVSAVETDWARFLTISAADLFSNEQNVPILFKVKALSSVLSLLSLLLDKYKSYDAAYLIFDDIATVLCRLRGELKEIDNEPLGNYSGEGESKESAEKSPVKKSLVESSVEKSLKKRGKKRISVGTECEGTISEETTNVSSSDNVILKLIVDKIEAVLAKFDAMKRNLFKYVAKEKEKPKIMRLFEPEIKPVLKFHTKGAQKEREKLLAKYKKEMKGAIREIRKDGRFLQKVKMRQQGRQDEERRRKVKEILGGCANQEGEIRNLKTKKQKMS